MTNQVLPRSCRSDCIKRLTNCAGLRHGKPRYNAFTLIELILVVGIIMVLAGLVLTTVGYARKKGARARAETEIAAMSAACENYKADNGVYPTSDFTNGLDPRFNGDPTTTGYKFASFDLYTRLSGDSSGTRSPTGKSYMVFKPNMLFPADQTLNVQYIQDPFGNSYGYSTAYQAWAEGGSSGPQKGYNPTFDLWSTANSTDPNQWIKNW